MATIKKIWNRKDLSDPHNSKASTERKKKKKHTVTKTWSARGFFFPEKLRTNVRICLQLLNCRARVSF